MSRGVPSKAVLLVGAAKRAARNQAFMASVMSADHNGTFDVAAFASDLGTAEASIVALALCQRPRAAPEHFSKDVSAIAAHSGIPVEIIAALVRRADAVAAMRSAVPTQLMAAAQDEIESPQTPSKEP